MAVLLPLPLTGPYDYRVPDGMTLAAGDYVEVPLGPRRLAGVVWGVGEGAFDFARLRPVARRFDLSPMAEVTRRFVDWVAGYTLAPAGLVLKMAISVPLALETPRPAVVCRATGVPLPGGFRLTAERRRVLEAAAAELRPASELAAAAGCGPAVVRGLLDAGLLEMVPSAPEPSAPLPDWRCPGPELSADQAAAARGLTEALAAGRYAVTLIDGVTGSGKTEVYFEAIAACLAAGRQALVLLPEIALGAQWLERFRRRFGAAPGLWHSELTPGVRRATWRAVAEGTLPVVVGARSALFLPYADLGLIVVDEEHESAFKQEEVVIYQARDMAVARAWLGGIPVALVSATPSLETLINVESGRYRRCHLPARHGGASLPAIEIVDLRAQPVERPRRWLAPPLRTAITAALEAGEQAMIFLNRRGYAPLTLCRGCGFRLQCAQCSAWLVEHRAAGRLVCHHCGLTLPPPERCPQCERTDSFAACGPGVERVAEEVAELFPQARAAVMASDTLTGPGAIDEMVRKVGAHELDLLIGTQVMAKGHHFPLLTLVGVVDADLGLGGGDLRAAERTYQLLHQVSGRAGRAERPGRVMLQSFQPEHPVIQALLSGERDAFLAAEAEERRDGQLPPFGRLAALVVSGEDMETVDAAARQLGRTAPRSDEVEVLGPAPAPLALLRGRHRRRLLVKAPRTVLLQPLLRRWLAETPLPSGVRVQVDVDPYSFL